MRRFQPLCIGRPLLDTGINVSSAIGIDAAQRISRQLAAPDHDIVGEDGIRLKAESPVAAAEDVNSFLRAGDILQGVPAVSAKVEHIYCCR